jgi:hypothetical protein
MPVGMTGIVGVSAVFRIVSGALQGDERKVRVYAEEYANALEQRGDLMNAEYMRRLLSEPLRTVGVVKAAKDVVDCHDTGSYESEGQAFDALRSALAELKDGQRPAMTGCCADCGATVEVTVSPVNDIELIRAKQRCKCPSALHIWPTTTTAARPPEASRAEHDTEER